MAGEVGIEPTNNGVKVRCLNRLAIPQYYVEKGRNRTYITASIACTSNASTFSWRELQEGIVAL